MAYTGTTNYGFQKPAKENAFTVNDLNNALDKIDETIKDESPSALSVDLDDDMNLVVKLTSGDGSEIEDFTSLSTLIDSAGMGLLIVPTSFIGTAKITITDAFETVVVNNQNITGNIPLTNGQYKISVTQFGSVTKEANVLVIGNTDLAMDFSIFTLAVDGVESMTVGGISIPVGNVTVLKNNSNVEVKLTLEELTGTGQHFTVTKSMNCANNAAITADKTDSLIIRSSTTVTIQKTAEYEVWACGGGGGGGGAMPNYDNIYVGESKGYAGYGGDGGVVVAKNLNLNNGESIAVTIGLGGNRGSNGYLVAEGSSSHLVYPTSGETGGTTTFGTYISAPGGSGGGRAAGGAPDGGDGSNGQTMSIFGTDVNCGRGGKGSGSIRIPGTESAIDNSLLFPTAGDGGDGGTAPSSRFESSLGGLGGNGLNESYGKGGNGADSLRSGGGTTNATYGSYGAVVIVRLIA